MIIGFGETEKMHETSLKKQIKELVATEYSKDSKGFFCDSFIEKINKTVEDMSVTSREISDSYKKSPDFPERYYSFYSSVVGDANYIIFIIKFHHINRKHALSPDGWALFQNEIVFYENVSALRSKEGA